MKDEVSVDPSGVEGQTFYWQVIWGHSWSLPVYKDKFSFSAYNFIYNSPYDYNLLCLFNDNYPNMFLVLIGKCLLNVKAWMIKCDVFVETLFSVFKLYSIAILLLILYNVTVYNQLQTEFIIKNRGSKLRCYSIIVLLTITNIKRI